MKKLFLLLPCLLLTACPYNYVPEIPKEITNPECNFFGDGVYVFQVLDNGMIVEMADYWISDYGVINKNSFSRRNNSDLFYIPLAKKQLKDIYDGAAFDNDGYCFKQDGTYSYINAVGAKKTIRKIKSIDKRISNPEYKDTATEIKDLQKIDEPKKPLPNVGGPGFMEN